MIQKFANTLPHEHRNTPWSGQEVPAWKLEAGLSIAALIVVITWLVM
jgi:hypothetical protein